MIVAGCSIRPQLSCHSKQAREADNTTVQDEYSRILRQASCLDSSNVLMARTDCRISLCQSSPIKSLLCLCLRLLCRFRILTAINIVFPKRITGENLFQSNQQCRSEQAIVSRCADSTLCSDSIGFHVHVVRP